MSNHRTKIPLRVQQFSRQSDHGVTHSHHARGSVAAVHVAAAAAGLVGWSAGHAFDDLQGAAVSQAGLGDQHRPRGYRQRA